VRAVVRAKCPPQDIIAACERQDLNASIYDPTKELERTSHGTQFTTCFTSTKVQILTLTGLSGEEAVSPAKDAAMLGYETPLSEVCLPLLATPTPLSLCNPHRAEALHSHNPHTHTHTHTQYSVRRRQGLRWGRRRARATSRRPTSTHTTIASSSAWKTRLLALSRSSIFFKKNVYLLFIVSVSTLFISLSC
jgi:hypothetical protein